MSYWTRMGRRTTRNNYKAMNSGLGRGSSALSAKTRSQSQPAPPAEGQPSGTRCWLRRWTRASRDGGSWWDGAADKRDQAHWLAERGFVRTPVAVYHNRGGRTDWTGGTRGWISQGTRTISGINTGAQGVATARRDRKAAIAQHRTGTTNWRVDICVRGKWPPPVSWVIPCGMRSHARSRPRKVRRRTHQGGAADGWAYKAPSGIAVTRNVDRGGTGQFR